MDKRQKLHKRNFRGFPMNHESYSKNVQFEQWPSSVLSIQVKQKPQKFSLHLDEIQRTSKLPLA